MECKTQLRGRSATSCTTDDVVTALDNAENAQNSSTARYLGDVFDENGTRIDSESKMRSDPSENYVVIRKNYYDLSYKYELLSEQTFLQPSHYSLLDKILQYYWKDYLNYDLGVLML